MTTILGRLWKEEGQDLTEYGLLLVLVALAAVAGMNTLATAINNAFSSAASNLTGNTKNGRFGTLRAASRRVSESH